MIKGQGKIEKGTDESPASKRSSMHLPVLFLT